jgi:hypothetical protein
MKPIEELSNTALIALYKDTVVDWWKDNEELSSVCGILLDRIEVEMRKRMKR